MTDNQQQPMSQRELTGWALYISECWSDLARERKNKRSLYAKARQIVVFDRVITGRVHDR